MDERLERMRRCFQPRQWFTRSGEPDPFPLSEEDVFMWVYRCTKEDTFEVGYYTPDGEWFPESNYSTREEAAARVRYLNGGNT